MYQVFSSLLGHLHFFVHFSFTFMEHLFFGHPISIRASIQIREEEKGEEKERKREAKKILLSHGQLKELL